MPTRTVVHSIEGFTDAVAGPNAALRVERARSTLALTQFNHFSPSAGLRAVGAPPSQFLESNTTMEGRAANRAAVISLEERGATGRTERPEHRPTPGADRSRCRCGADATQPINSALGRVRSRIQQLNDWTQLYDVSQRLTNPLAGAIDAWDLIPFDSDAPPTPAQYTAGCARERPGAPPCERPVQVDRGCYHAGGVNYVLFGVLWRALEEAWRRQPRHVGRRIRGEGEMLHLIWLYKSPDWWSPGRMLISITGHDPGCYESSVRWARAGYGNWSPGRSPAPDLQTCTVDCPAPFARPVTARVAGLGVI
jgi:hypothetical protein